MPSARMSKIPPPPLISSTESPVAASICAANLEARGRKFQAPQYSMVTLIEDLPRMVGSAFRPDDTWTGQEADSFRTIDITTRRGRSCR